MNNAILSQCVGAAAGVVIRGIMPQSCTCGEADTFHIDYDAREVAGAIAYKCNVCKAIEYVSNTAPIIVA